ncbi:MAG: metal-dependent transcriptional regulator [Fidelibacterota bacterium]
MTVTQNWIDEVLEAIWIAREKGQQSLDKVRTICQADAQVPVDVEATLAEMTQRNLVTRERDFLDFTPEGEQKAQAIIRRHRLAERLLSDALNVSDQSMETTACQFEHILNPEVTDSVCSFLGHPPLCPHGSPIPQGICCSTYQSEKVKPLVSRLSELELGKEGKIAFITPSFHKRYDRLTALGIVTGNVIMVHQKKPSFVIRIGETELAVDKEIAREIYVRTT